MQIDHRQLNVCLEGEAPPLRVFVHEAEGIVALDVPPFADGFLERLDDSGWRAGSGQALEKRRFSTPDIPLDDDGKGAIASRRR